MRERERERERESRPSGPNWIKVDQMNRSRLKLTKIDLSKLKWTEAV